MKYFLFFLLTVLGLNGYTQQGLLEIDLGRISQEKVKYLVQDKLNGQNILMSNTLLPTWQKGQTTEKYHRLQSAYTFRKDVEEVWQTYQSTSPAEAWNGKMVSFGLLVSKRDNNVLYDDDEIFCGIDTGQVIFINLRLLKGLYNLAVGLEIVDIDSRQKTITYSYIKGGKSRGEQTIRFVPTRRGFTDIIHLTAHKGDSYVRDRWLYPWFHKLAINEFHRNMKRACLLREQNDLI